MVPKSTVLANIRTCTTKSTCLDLVGVELIRCGTRDQLSSITRWGTKMWYTSLYMQILKNIFNFNNQYVAPAVIVGVCVIIFGFILQIIAGKIINKENNITVAGTAERIVQSDTGKLTVFLNERNIGDVTGQVASRAITNSATKVVDYLKKSGFAENEIEVGNVSLSPICELSSQGYENCSLGIKGQTANKNITVNTKNINLIKDVSGRINNEIYGVNISNVNVEYLFNGLKDIRVDMLTEATKNAKERAGAVAKAGGSTLGSITSLSSGVFQVTAPNSVQVDDYGAYDTSTIEKKVTAVVKANFSIR